MEGLHICCSEKADLGGEEGEIMKEVSLYGGVEEACFERLSVELCKELSGRGGKGDGV